MTFPDFLRAEVLRLGDGVSSRGEPLAAIVLGVSPRTIRNWMYQTGAPNKAEEAGARVLLDAVLAEHELPRLELLLRPSPRRRRRLRGLE